MESDHSLHEEVMITDPLDNILAQHGQEPVLTPTSQRDHKKEEGFEKPFIAPLRQDLTKISKDLSKVKGVLGGTNGYPTVHQMVVGLERRVQVDGQTLRAIQDSLSSLGDRIAGVSAVQERRIRKQDREEKQDLKQQFVQAEGTKDVLRLLENIQSQFSSVIPSIVGKLSQISDTQEQEKENQKQQQLEQVAYRNVGQTPSDTEKAAEMETVLAKLEEIRNLCSIQAQADGPESSSGGASTKPPEVGFSISVLSFFELLISDL
jgi:leucyl aminopeptidase